MARKKAKKFLSVTDALSLSSRLQSMINRVKAGDTRPEMRGTISKLADAMASMEVTVESDLFVLSNRLAGEIGGSSIIQDPGWRDVVEAARSKKR